MRKYVQMVHDLEAELVRQILSWFDVHPDFDGLELKRPFVIQVDVDDTILDYDLGTEEGVVTKVMSDGTVILEDEREINLEDLAAYELAFILDEIDEDRYLGIIEI